MSKAPKVLGTLSIVFGSLVAAWSPLSLLMSSFLKSMSGAMENLPRAPGQPDPALTFGATEAMMQAQHGYLIGTTIMYLAMSAWLIVAGVGLVKRKQSGRASSLLWAKAALAIIVVQIVAFVAYLHPMQQRVMADYFAAHGSSVPLAMQAGSAGGVIGGVFALLIYAAYPIVLLAVLGKRAMVDEFTA